MKKFTIILVLLLVSFISFNKLTANAGAPTTIYNKLDLATVANNFTVTTYPTYALLSYPNLVTEYYVKNPNNSILRNCDGIVAYASVYQAPVNWYIETNGTLKLFVNIDDYNRTGSVYDYLDYYSPFEIYFETTFNFSNNDYQSGFENGYNSGYMDGVNSDNTTMTYTTIERVFDNELITMKFPSVYYVGQPYVIHFIKPKTGGNSYYSMKIGTNSYAINVNQSNITTDISLNLGSNYNVGIQDFMLTGLSYNILGNPSNPKTVDLLIPFTVNVKNTNGNYQDGYNKGHTDGYNEGYEEGRHLGEDVGYTAGYNAGKNDFYTIRYTEGYNTAKTEYYDSRYNTGYNTGYNDGINSNDNTIYQKGYTDGTSNIFMSSFDKWIVPAIITVLLLGGFIAYRKNRGE